MRGAKLHWASLCGTDLREASLDGALLEFCSFDDRTVWPPGYPRERVGVRRHPESASALCRLDVYARSLDARLVYDTRHDHHVLELTWDRGTSSYRLSLYGSESLSVTLYQTPRLLKHVWPKPRAWRAFPDLMDGFDWEALRRTVDEALALSERGLESPR